jgi:hypothetical protein
MVTQNWKRTLVAPSISLICLGYITYVQLSSFTKLLISKASDRTEFLKYDKQEQAALSLLKNSPPFGFDNLLADWTFLRFLQYFGDSSARKQTGYALTPRYFEIIVDRDPRFIQSYNFLSTTISLYAGRPEQSISLLSKGLEVLSPQIFPTAHYIWIYKGTDQLLFMGDIEGAKHSYEMAATWADVQKDPQSQALSRSARQTVAFLSRSPNSKKARINAWVIVLISTFDQQTRQRAINNIRALGGDVSFSSKGAVRVKFSNQD